MKTSNHFRKSNVKLPELTAPNPLDAFPTKGDVIKRNFLYAPPAAEASVEEGEWLKPDQLPDAKVLPKFFK